MVGIKGHRGVRGATNGARHRIGAKFSLTRSRKGHTLAGKHQRKDRIGKERLWG